MSTPISDLPDEIDDFEEDEYKYAPKRRRGGKLGMLSKHKDLAYVFLAVIAASYISIESFRYSVPPQVFSLGDAPVQAVITVIVFVIIRMVLKNMLN